MATLVDSKFTHTVVTIRPSKRSRGVSRSCSETGYTY